MRGLNVYSNLAAQRRMKRDSKSRRKAEYLASLPKHPVKRLAYRLHPKRFFAYWFSREGGIMALKIAGVGALAMVVMVGAMFAFFRRELDAIRPGELSKRVQTTVSKYYDRNGVLLWDDKGDGDYKLVIESKDISKYMKDATVAIEDKDFYSHAGISLSGIARAVVNNFSGGSTQGGSTLTQQLVKQVFFADEAQDRGLSGIPRKIKEAILAIEVERMYNKDQILTLYLNEAPYGGRRNGVESAAQTYFGKPAKDVTLPEAALLASIPQLPGLFDPYNPEGHEDLLARQHIVLDNMAEQGYISEKEAEDAKNVAVLDGIRPEAEAYAGIKAPHFVRMVQQQLASELGKATVGRGGLTIKTTLDFRMQEIVEKEMTALFNSSIPKVANFDNGAATVIDAQTGQILAMMGSRDFNYPGYGQDNAATSFLQPGSSIKPFVYANLFKQRSGQNYGAGSILSDEPINNIYPGLQNFDKRFRGNIPIRSGLAESRNVPAVKAMYITGRDSAIQTIHDVGDRSYCTDGVDKQVGLAAAIGGCGLRQVEHVNSFATLARGGVYKKEASVLEVKNAQGQTLKQWKDDSSKQVLDPQIPYILSDILSDDSARAPSFGRGAQGLNVPGVKTATKTGTSNLGEKSKDLWMMSYSPKIAMGIWVGNHDSSAMSDALSSRIGPTLGDIMGPIHTDILEKENQWKPGDWFTQPQGIQKLNVSGRWDLFPSWYSKAQSSGIRMTFDTVSKKKATDCTPERAKTSQFVSKFQDPVTKKDVYLASNGYDATREDDVHKCGDVKPFVSSINVDKISGGTYRITASVNQGTHGLKTVEFKADGQSIGSVGAGGSGSYSIDYTFPSEGTKEIVVTVTDTALYDNSASRSAAVTVASSDGVLNRRGGRRNG